MPRKNNRSKIKFQPFEMNVPKNSKKRYASKIEAEKAAEFILLTRGVELAVYRDIDGGWYLTSQKI
ncbi:MAG: hypothetical protein Q4A27_00780 [bacterium]|nr:hypothetical protein [bacterium]